MIQKTALEIQSRYCLLRFSVENAVNEGSADVHLCSLNPSFRSDGTHQAGMCEAKTSKGILNCLISLWMTQMEKQFISEITLADVFIEKKYTFLSEDKVF